MGIENAAELPSLVVYRNALIGFENLEIADLFELIPRDQVKDLKRGETIWLGPDPTHKVHNFRRAEVTSVTEFSHRITLRYKGPTIDGTDYIWKDKGAHRVYRCISTDRLRQCISEHPEATMTPG